MPRACYSCIIIKISPTIRLIRELLDSLLKRQAHSQPLVTVINTHNHQPVGEKVYYLNLCSFKLTVSKVSFSTGW